MADHSNSTPAPEITPPPRPNQNIAAGADPFLDLVAEHASHDMAFPGDDDKEKEAAWLDQAAAIIAKMRETAPVTLAGAAAGIAFVRNELRDMASTPAYVDILTLCLSTLRGEA